MAKKVSMYGILVALAFIASYIEVLIPFNFHVPGMKLGLANIIVLLAMYTGGLRTGITVSIIRIVLVGFTFGNPYSAIYGLSGGILSFVIMAVLKKTDFFGIVGVSIAGGVTHNIGQLFCAMVLLKLPAVFSYLYYMIFIGVITGALIGIIGEEILKRTEKIVDFI
ncbi:MAG: Gx transporter family protein [Catonella sp.]|uniref:Gx transporter family protein n=1 Tax=Catonella sp. TaxID=2382125 RepID=UPI003FA18C47